MGAASERCPVAISHAMPSRCQHWDERQGTLRRLRTLSLVARALSAIDRGDAVVSALHALEEGLGVRRCTLMLSSPDGGSLEFAAFSSGQAETNSLRRGQGILGRVLETGRPVSVARICDEPTFQHLIHRRAPDEIRTCAFACVPVMLATDVIGTLSADVPHALGDIEEHTHLLGIAATMLAHSVHLRREALRERAQLEEENLRLRQRLGEQIRPERMIGSSHAMREVFLRLAQVAPSDVSVLLLGESGTGKELAAEALHYASPRAKGPFVRVNCAALNENLLDSELFGHEKGAFTGAVARRLGRIEEARGGTLFLDEIGEFSAATQVKLLRVLQQREFERVGSNQVIKADVRVVCATNRDLEAMVQAGGFRLDLYYRINVFPLRLPALRERREDILLLADHFAQACGLRLGRPVQRISTPAIDAMRAYHWPGNVRELENAIEHAMLLSTDGAIHLHHLPPTLQMPAERAIVEPLSLTARTEALERDLISDALKQTDGSQAAAARLLGITPRILRYKARQLGLV